MNRKSNSVAPLALLVVLVIAAGFLLMVKPKRADVADARIELETATADLATTRQAIASMKASVDDSELKALLNRIPRNDQTPEFIEVISREAGAANVRVSTLSFSSPNVSTLGSGSQYDVTMTVKGPRVGVEAFLAALHAIERLTIIERASVSSAVSLAEGSVDSGSGTDPNGDMSLAVDLSIFTGQLTAPTQ
jgi:Tfp pilus assembly protein PilO